MKGKKGTAIITIKCDNKEELKNVLNTLKDAMEPVAKNEAEEETDDKEPEAFRPKRGDICTYIEDDEPMAIFRHNGRERIDEDGCRMLDGDLSLGFSGNILQPYIVVKGDDQECPADECRLATEEEINLFNAFVEMYEKNEKNAVWAPRKGEDFWTVKLAFYEGGKFTPVRNPSEFWDSPVLSDVKEIGWVFPTEEKCQQFCDKLNEAIKNVKP